MKTIRVAAVQIPNVMGDTTAQQELHIPWLEQAKREGADLVIFPECSLTGYTIHDPADYAIAANHADIAALETAAHSLGLAVGYGFIEAGAHGAKPTITYVVFDTQTGGRLVYRKTHLGTTEASYEAGNDLPVASIAGVCVGVQQCWESHIPDIATTLRTQGAEVLLCPYAMGAHGSGRVESWDRYMPARASDNGMFVLACNATFPEALNGRVGGGIAAWGPDGGMLGSYSGHDAHMECFTLDAQLPRENSGGGMRSISYFERRRPELYE